MIRSFYILLLTAFLFQPVFSQTRVTKIKLIHTTDVHGSYFPYNFSTRTPEKGSLARVSTYIKNVRKTYHQNALLFDNGDILQGQPTSYYYNYIDTSATHLCALMQNYIKYDLGNLGNHDIETSTKVFTRWAKECDFPIVCANAISNATNKPYYEPYHIFIRNGVKIAVLGMITAAIPSWLSTDVYAGFHFDDMETTARYWVNLIKEKEHPDILVGLFHSGIDAMTLNKKYRENASEEVAEHIPGFDVVMSGHDHLRYCKWVKNIAGQNVLVINPGKGAGDVSNVDIKVVRGRNGRIISKQIDGQLIPLDNVEPDPQFMSEFKAQYDTLQSFTSHKLGVLDRDLSIHDAFFGPSDFLGAIHSIQLNLTGADISFAAPFSQNAELKKGDFLVSDLFNMYKYENKLYVIKMTGKEIKDYLEASYDGWINQMKKPTDHLLQLTEYNGNVTFKNELFNFDSAAGIYYTVDVTKNKGERISISKMADGEPFFANKTYQVALNSYRGNGGGGLLTAAGIPEEEQKERIIYRSDNEMRYYIMKYIEQNGTNIFHSLNLWKFIPTEWTKAAAQRDAELLFGKKGANEQH